MELLRKKIIATLEKIKFPGGKNLISGDSVRAFEIQDEVVKFIIEVGDGDVSVFKSVAGIAKKALEDLEGVSEAQIILTAQKAATPNPNNSPPPNLKIGGHPDPKIGKIKPLGVRHIIAVGSGKGGVGKSTLAANLAVSMAKSGLKVGLLDADIYGPSQPKMMGVSGKPETPDGKKIIPLKAFGVTVMSIGFMLDPSKAVVWRGPMLQGALQQMLGQVMWGELDVLLVDLPPGTGDVQLTLCQKTDLTGAIIVSTPQDVALIDATKAIDMFKTLNVPILGLVENMSTYLCPNCGHEEHIFGHGGVKSEAFKMGLPFLGEIPLDLKVRLSGDSGIPIASVDGNIGAIYDRLVNLLSSNIISG